jgi:hypothetical protein
VTFPEGASLLSSPGSTVLMRRPITPGRDRLKKKNLWRRKFSRFWSLVV